MDLYEIYTNSLPIVGTENLIMGITLLLLFGRNGTKIARYRSGIRFMATAMLTMALINYLELLFGDYLGSPFASMSMVIVAASTQLFLLLFAYASLLDTTYVTKKRIVVEVLLIVLFTIPPLFVDAEINPEQFFPLFYISIGYYVVKLILNVVAYARCYYRTRIHLQNYYSETHANVMNWTHYTFYILLFVGAISVIVPLTNRSVLIVYQALLFVTYFYLYWEILYHEVVFTNLSSILERTEEKSTISESPDNDATSRQPDIGWSQELDNWISQGYYAISGITIDDVATQLKVNRTTLSLYLNMELKQNFYEWVSNIRMQEAKRQLLDNPTLPISEIATYVGIEDRSNFDKLFKRIVGVSPASYRVLEGRKKLENGRGSRKIQ